MVSMLERSARWLSINLGGARLRRALTFPRATIPGLDGVSPHRRRGSWAQGASLVGRILLLLLVVVTLIGGLAGLAEVRGAEPRYAEHELKATYLFKFFLFTDWPSNRLPSRGAPFVIGVVGHPEVAAYLEVIGKTNVINGRRLNVRRLTANEDFTGCQIVFIGQEIDPQPILSKLKKTGILIVGEHEDFTKRGGMINFVMDRETVKFQANPRVANEDGLEISSKLLDVVRGWGMIVNVRPEKGTR